MSDWKKRRTKKISVKEISRIMQEESVVNMRQITTDEIVRILCGDISILDEMLEDIQTKNNTSEGDVDV